MPKKTTGKSGTVDNKLPPHIQAVASKPGRVRCMRCPNEFDSPDKIRIRICPDCSRVNAEAFVKPEVSSFGAGGGADDYDP